MNTLRAAGILEGSVSQIEGISPNFDLPAILRTWAMQMSAGFPLNAMLFGKMRPGKIYPVDVLCGVMVAGAAVAALAALDDRFMAENLSPGGSADLLALTYLLHFITTEGNNDE